MNHGHSKTETWVLSRSKVPSDWHIMLPQVLGYAGGLYVARNFLRDRLDEIRGKLEVERAAKER